MILVCQEYITRYELFWFFHNIAVDLMRKYLFHFLHSDHFIDKVWQTRVLSENQAWFEGGWDVYTFCEYDEVFKLEIL